jgi:hypothetical protein
MIKTILFIVTSMSLVLGMLTNSLGAQSSVRKNAQDILAKLDQEMNLGDGLVKSNLILIRRTGASETWKVNLFRSEGNLLYLMERRGRGLETKLLSLDEGDKVFVYNTLSAKLFRKAEEEKYEIFQNSGFSFIDLSGYLYQANYDPIVNGETEINGESYTRVTLKPIITYDYKKLVLLMSKDERPFRIDFHDKDGVLYKSLNIKYAKIKFKSSKGLEQKDVVARLEMLDLSTGNIGVLEIQEVDTTVKNDSALFEVENLAR